MTATFARGRRRLGLALAASALLAACATPRLPGADVTHERLDGRMALRVEGRPGLSADFSLGGDAERGDLLLSGPLGATLAQARWEPGRAELLGADGQRRQQADLDTLVAQALGEPLPVRAWFDWLHGRPHAAWPSTPRADGRPGFAQAGWQVDLERFADGRVTVQRSTAPAVSLNLTLDAPRR